MATIALPLPTEILSAIRSSCASLTSRSLIEVSTQLSHRTFPPLTPVPPQPERPHPDRVVAPQIDPEAIDAFLNSIDFTKFAEATSGGSHGIRLPLRFDSLEEELNIISSVRSPCPSKLAQTMYTYYSDLARRVLALLNFLSGYRLALKRLTSRGAWLSILSLVLSAHLSGKPESTPLSTKGMLAATPASLAALMQMQTHTESDHPTLGSAVKMGVKDDEAFEILDLLAEVCKSTGEVLRDAGKRSLGEWVYEKLGEAEGDAGVLVHAVSGAGPARADDGWRMKG